jgi:hypothetical protein
MKGLPPVLALSAVILASSVDAAPLRDRVGVAHAGGKYSVAAGSPDYLNEGAQLILEDLGSRVIKLWLTRRPEASYALNSPLWANTHDDLVSVAAHPYYQQVFSMPFSTYILVVDTPDTVWFGDGMSRLEEDTEERALHDLTRYLMRTYAGTGKTFILQNWEADWLVRLAVSSGTLDDRDPPLITVNGIGRWLAARQRGVERARARLSSTTGVTVKHAIEVNHVWRAKYQPWRVSVTDDVLPAVHADMYSYSAWELGDDPTGEKLKEMLTFLDERTPGSGNVYVGEYGVAENVHGSAVHLSQVAAHTRAALDWGAAYVVYWQTFCNEFAVATPASTVLNGDMRGFWLVRPDGTKSPVWFYLKELLAEGEPAVPRRRSVRSR